MKADLNNPGWSIPQAKSDRARGARLLMLALVLAMAFAAQARGQFLYRQVALPELSQRAPIIVQGRIVEARYEPHPNYPHVATVLVTLQVEQMLRGPGEQQFSFRELLLFPQAARGKRGYLAGQRLLLFLPAASRYGLSSPLGGEQGRFHIWRDQRGNELVENEFRNAGLFKGLAEAATRAGVSLSPQQARLAGVARGPVPLEELVSVVKQFASVARTE
ncbi:MAG: hypothetical protein MUP80_01680 [Acidobacteriia bacterium]|nr:hypothetical protein [Terriglobia bacterium]